MLQYEKKKAGSNLKVSRLYFQLLKLVCFSIQGNKNSGGIHPKLFIEFTFWEGKSVILIFSYLLNCVFNMSTMNMNYFYNKKKSVALKKNP